MKVCARCGKTLAEDLAIARSSACPFCRADLRTCSNCVFYAPGAHWDCRETISELVRDKSKANFCDFFRFASTGAPRETGKTETKAKEDFSKLFGNE